MNEVRASPKKDRKFTGILYPDATNYRCEEALALLNDVFSEWSYCLHDKDLNEDGELKKPHYHWVGKLRNPVTADTIAKKLGVNCNDVEYCKSYKSSVRYLTHLDDANKFQYPTDSVVASFDYSAYSNPVKAEEMASNILDEIILHGNTNTVSLTKWAIENGYWSEFRRGFAVWQVIISDLRSLKYE